MIEIQSTHCCGCGLCSAVCPKGLIGVEGHMAVLQHHDCMNCGHCQSICPQNAITLNGDSSPLQEVREPVEFSEVKHLIQSNRSIRFYDNEPVPAEKIEEILRVLDYSASAKNNQLVSWIVVSGMEKIQQFSLLCESLLPEDHEVHQTIATIRNPITVNAPHLLIACSDKRAVKGADDCLIKTTHATMLMHSQGIGSCFLGYLVGFLQQYPQLRECLSIEDHLCVHSALGFGYHSEEIYHKIPSRKKANITFLE